MGEVENLAFGPLQLTCQMHQWQTTQREMATGHYAARSDPNSAAEKTAVPTPNGVRRQKMQPRKQASCRGCIPARLAVQAQLHFTPRRVPPSYQLAKTSRSAFKNQRGVFAFRENVCVRGAELYGTTPYMSMYMTGA